MSSHGMNITSSTSDNLAVAEHTPAPGDTESVAMRAPPHNRTSLLLQLPRELLDEIISLATNGQHVGSWIKLGQICSALREVLLGLRHIWGDSIYSWPDGRNRDELLARAGPKAPLSLHVSKYGAPADALRFAVKYLTRARVINASQLTFVEWFLKHATLVGLPLLEEVVLRADTAVDATMWQPRDAPRLRHVVLENISWNFRPRALTTLKIIFRVPSRAYSTTQFLDLLQHTGRLRTLELRNCLPLFSDEEAFAHTVPLPVLQTLNVRDVKSGECALQFWRMLAVNPGASVKFEYPHDARRNPEYTFHDAALFKRHLGDRVPTRLDVRLENRLLDVGICCADAQLDPGSAPQETLRLTFLGSFEDSYNEVLRCICTDLDAFNVTHLFWNVHLDNEHRRDDVLKDFARVEHMGVYSLLQGTCKALTFGRTSGMMPRLRVLTSEVANMDAKPALSYPDGLTTGDVLAMMRSRAARDCPLEKLQLRRAVVNGPGGSDSDETTRFIEEITLEFPGRCVISK